MAETVVKGTTTSDAGTLKALSDAAKAEKLKVTAATEALKAKKGQTGYYTTAKATGEERLKTARGDTKFAQEANIATEAQLNLAGRGIASAGARSPSSTASLGVMSDVSSKASGQIASNRLGAAKAKLALVKGAEVYSDAQAQNLLKHEDTVSLAQAAEADAWTKSAAANLSLSEKQSAINEKTKASLNTFKTVVEKKISDLIGNWYSQDDHGEIISYLKGMIEKGSHSASEVALIQQYITQAGTTDDDGWDNKFNEIRG